MINILDLTVKTHKLLSEYELCTLQASQVSQLIEKLKSKEVAISVIGQFKRGKTTLINSILGKNLLPVGIVPITLAVTKLYYGPNSSKVYFTNGLSEDVAIEDLHKYLSEQENKANEMGVAEVQVHTESDFLEGGLVLVDTPGVGSVHENNSKAAYDFVKESDGVIFMLSVDSPINQIEVDFLKSVKAYAGKFYFAVNKIDTIDDGDLQEYLEYCTDLIRDIMELDAYDELKLIPLSARKCKGIEVLTESIRRDVLEESTAILEESVRLKLLDIINTTKAQINAYREILKMPPLIFNRRFEEFGKFMIDIRAKLETLDSDSEAKYMNAQLNEEKTKLSAKVEELFGIAYHYDVDRAIAAESISQRRYIAEIERIYDDLENAMNAIFMYKEDNAYTVARRIEDLNILMHEMTKLKRNLDMYRPYMV